MILQEGEVREVGIEVINQNNEDFIVDACEYSIIENGIEIEKGVATIDGHKLLTLFSARKKGKYYVIFKYHIGPEIIKSKIHMEVL